MAKKQVSEKAPKLETLESKIYQVVFEKINDTGLTSVSADLAESIAKDILKLIEEK